jgi:hypothetical protein
MTPMRACINGPRPSAAMISASMVPLRALVFGPRQPRDVVGCVLEGDELPPAGKRDWIIEGAGPTLIRHMLQPIANLA